MNNFAKDVPEPNSSKYQVSLYLKDLILRASLSFKNGWKSRHTASNTVQFTMNVWAVGGHICGDEMTLYLPPLCRQTDRGTVVHLYCEIVSMEYVIGGEKGEI